MSAGTHYELTPWTMLMELKQDKMPCVYLNEVFIQHVPPLLLLSFQESVFLSDPDQ